MFLYTQDNKLVNINSIEFIELCETTWSTWIIGGYSRYDEKIIIAEFRYLDDAKEYFDKLVKEFKKTNLLINIE